MRSSKFRLAITLSCGIAAVAMSTASASAQSTSTSTPSSSAEAGTDQLSEIVVTAQKRTENLLDVPVAVSALSSDTLTKQNLVQLTDYATRIPGLAVNGPRTNNISIRGINAGGSTSPTVAVTIDDVPFGSTSWAGVSQFPDLDPGELQRIEVLRGPQGTLYGASSLGGLIKYVTRDADPNDFSGRVEGTLTNVEEGDWGYALRGSLNVPVVKDVLGIRVSGLKRREAPIVDQYNRTTGALVQRDADRVNIEGFRVAATFKPFDALTINASYLQQIRKTKNGGPTLLQLTVPTNYKPLYDYFANDSAGAFGRTKVQLTQLRGELDLGFATLTSISGWGKLRTDSNRDATSNLRFIFTGIPPAIPAVYPNTPAGSQVRINEATDTSKFSQEVRLASSGDGPFSWLIGGFYTNEHTNLAQDVYATQANLDLIGSVIVFPLPSTYKEYAIFGDATYRFSDKFDIQIGARYSENKQTYQANQTVVPGAVPLFGPTRVGVVAHSKDNSTTWLVSPRYHINDDVMVFARVAKGYRPGGPNTAVAPQATFDPDTVTNYELGLKGQFLDRKLTIDGSLFYIDWKNIQLGATTVSGISYFTNGGDARSKGLELTAQLALPEGWLISGNMTVADAELAENLPVIAGNTYLLGAKGDPLPNAAKFSSNFGIEKRWQLTEGVRLTVGGNYNHVGQRDTNFRSSAASVARRAKLRAPAYDVVDLRAGLSGDFWDATFFVRNVTNERGIIDLTDTGGVATALSALYVQPRTFGLDVSFSF